MSTVYLATEHPTRQRRTTDRYHRSTDNGRTAACSPDISLSASTAVLDTDISTTAPRRLCGNCARTTTRTHTPLLDPDPTRRRNPRLLYRSLITNVFHAPATAPTPTPALTAACRPHITLDETMYARPYDTTIDYPYRDRYGQPVYAARMCTACADIYPGMLRRYTFLPATSTTTLHAVATSDADNPTALCADIPLAAPDHPTRLDLAAYRIHNVNPTRHLPSPSPVLCMTCLALLRTRDTRTRTRTQKGDS